MAQYDVVVKAVDQTRGPFRNIEAGLKSIQDRSDRLNKTLDNLGIGITAFGAAATAALGLATRSAITFANEIDDVANATDISAQAILGFAAAVQDAGGSSQKALDGILKLNQNISDAAGDIGNLRESFAEVGITLTDLGRLSSEDILGKVVAGLGGISDKGRQAALATELLGKSAKGVSFTQASASIGQFTQQAGGAAAAQKKIADATAVLEQAFGRLRLRISEAIAPIADFITQLNPATLDRAIDLILGLGAAFVALGAATIAVRALRAGVLLLTAAVAGLTVVAAPLSAFGAVLYTIAGGIAGIAAAVTLNIGKSAETWDRWTGAAGRAYDAVLKFFNISNDKPTFLPQNEVDSEIQRLQNRAKAAAGGTTRDLGDKNLDTFRKAIAEARKEYELFLPLLKSNNPAEAAGALDKVNAAAKTLQLILSDDIVLRNFNSALRDQADTLRQQNIIYADTANILKENNVALAQQEAELRKNAAIIGDSATQQRSFNIELEKNKQTLQAQVTNLSLATAAYDSGRISLTDYLKTLQGVDAALLTAEQRQLQFNQAISSGMADAAMQAQMAGQAMAEAYSTGDMQRYLQIYEQYKNVLGATVTGEMASARKGARDELDLMQKRTMALKTLTAEYKANGGTGSAEYRRVAEALGMSTDAIDRMVTVHGSAIDRMVEDARFYEQSIGNAATTFSSEFTRAFMEGRNALDSFRNFFSNIANDIANRIIKQQLADPIADALSGIVGKVIGGMGSGGESGGGGFFSSIISGVGGFLGDIFGGFFADGGTLGAGQFGVVGEEGPELITGPANITPMNDMKSAEGSLQVVFQIQAIDTQTGAQFLLQNKPLITSMITQAYNSRGRRGPLD